MDDIIQRVINFFTSTAHSIGKKLIIAILALIVIVLINDHFGISYYYFTNMKIEHFRKIEEAKSYCANDSSLVAYFNEIEHNSLNRKTYIAKFLELFDKSPKVSKHQPSRKKLTTVKKESKPDNILTKLFPEKPIRSKLWNTITSSFLQIIVAFLMFIMMIKSFFDKKGERLTNFFTGFLGLIFLSFMIWFLQWLFGLIPVILNRAYINYTLNVVINLMFISLVIRAAIVKEKNKN